MTNHLSPLIERFPEYRQKIQYLFEINSKFAEMCQDYRATVHSLNHWLASSETSANDHIYEYTHVKNELEQEILRVLTMVPSHSDT